MFLFADFAVTQQGAVTIGLAALLAFLLGKFLFQKDTEIENHRKAAIDVANILTREGFKRLPQFASNYAVGDYSGMVHELKSAARDFQDPTILEAELQAVFEKQLRLRVSDAQKRLALLGKLKELGLLNLVESAPAAQRPAA